MALIVVERESKREREKEGGGGRERWRYRGPWLREDRNVGMKGSQLINCGERELDIYNGRVLKRF